MRVHNFAIYDECKTQSAMVLATPVWTGGVLFIARWCDSKWDGLKISPICLLHCCDKISVPAIFGDHRFRQLCSQPIITHLVRKTTLWWAERCTFTCLNCTHTGTLTVGFCFEKFRKKWLFYIFAWLVVVKRGFTCYWRCFSAADCCWTYFYLLIFYTWWVFCLKHASKCGK